MKKIDREKIFNKYGGKCAYCGCELKKGWHADHVEPIRRNFEYNSSKKRMEYNGTCLNPKNDNLDNIVPSCASCNIFKHAQPLESFRVGIEMLVDSLNSQSKHNIYKIAKRFGLITENKQKIVFYFESFKSN